MSQTKEPWPANMGFTMPAEWEHHHGTWLVWPQNPTDWPGKISTIRWVYVEIIRRIAPGETVHLLVNSAAEEKVARRHLTKACVDLSAIDFIVHPTNRGWTRDSGPIFVRREGEHPETAVVNFHFNAWAKYPDWQKDRTIPVMAATRRKKRLFDARCEGREFVLEGGAIDVNGKGALLTTEECLLDPAIQVRNPGLNREQIEATLEDNLGITQVLWLGHGVAGDDTHGHVDDLCRFVNPTTVVLAQERDPKEANYRPLEENRERLQGMRLENGGKLEIVSLPMPAPIMFEDYRLPASYANFYIANAAVIVPTFNDPNDRIALGILSELFPDRPVIGIHAMDLVLGLGTLHCLSQQEPA